MTNGRLKERAIEALESSKSETPADEKLDILISLTLDIGDNVESHEGRISTLEAYPITVKRVAKFLGGLGAVAAALVAIYALVNLT